MYVQMNWPVCRFALKKQIWKSPPDREVYYYSLHMSSHFLFITFYYWYWFEHFLVGVPGTFFVQCTFALRQRSVLLITPTNKSKTMTSNSGAGTSWVISRLSSFFKNSIVFPVVRAKFRLWPEAEEIYPSRASKIVVKEVMIFHDKTPWDNRGVENNVRPWLFHMLYFYLHSKILKKTRQFFTKTQILTKISAPTVYNKANFVREREREIWGL